MRPPPDPQELTKSLPPVSWEAGSHRRRGLLPPFLPQRLGEGVVVRGELALGDVESQGARKWCEVQEPQDVLGSHYFRVYG